MPPRARVAPSPYSHFTKSVQWRVLIVDNSIWCFFAHIPVLLHPFHHVPDCLCRCLLICMAQASTGVLFLGYLLIEPYLFIWKIIYTVLMFNMILLFRSINPITPAGHPFLFPSCFPTSLPRQSHPISTPLSETSSLANKMYEWIIWIGGFFLSVYFPFFFFQKKMH